MENTITEINTGTIVLYDGGWYRVRKVTKNTVNLGAIFGSHLYFKGVSKELVTEDQAAWYANWQQSDTYRQM
jgi:hypothetical protein